MVNAMNILLGEIRIQNFRSIENVSFKLNKLNILIGQNNAGKSNILKAIDIAFNGTKSATEDDIYVGNGEHLDKGKKAIIDLKLLPYNKGSVVKHFSEFWISVFTEKWIVTNPIDGDYVGIRTVIEYDIRKNDYVVNRLYIKEWGDSIEHAVATKKQAFNSEMYDYINCFYMDAKRDVIDDLRDRKSYFGKATSKIDLTEEQIDDIERKLSEVNDELVNGIEAISDTKETLSQIATTLGSSEGKLRIEPLAREIGDLHKGIDIKYADGNSATFSVMQHGMGTRSWVSFLTLGAYVNYFYKSILKNDSEADELSILTLEEPEAHLHPQAQRQIYNQLCEFNGQKIVSTHSTHVLSQAGVKDVIQVQKIDGKTKARRFNAENYSEEEIRKIEREVVRTQGELIFSNIIVLCEGITEEQALPVYFKEFFGYDPVFAGVNFIAVSGQGYQPFLKFIKEFDLKWYIFSDGEKEACKSVSKAVKEVFSLDINNCANIFIIGNGYDIEKMMIKEMDHSYIINAINKVNDDDEYYNKYMAKQQAEPKKHREKTDKPKCTKCGQPIYEDVEDSDADLTGDEFILYSCMTAKSAKAKYAADIAEEIVSNPEPSKRIPQLVFKMFEQMEKNNGLKRRSIDNGIEFNRDTEKDS